jgi:hypothetical protein
VIGLLVVEAMSVWAKAEDVAFKDKGR